MASRPRSSKREARPSSTAWSVDYFTDDDGHLFEGWHNRMRKNGIVSGCNPPANDRYCPDGRVYRDVMAVIIGKAKGWTTSSTNYFVDDNGSMFEGWINRMRANGIVTGCNPPTNNQYCPSDVVTRAAVSKFLVNAFGPG